MDVTIHNIQRIETSIKKRIDDNGDKYYIVEIIGIDEHLENRIIFFCDKKPDMAITPDINVTYED